MSRRSERRVVPPGEDDCLPAVVGLAERIREADGVLRQRRSYLEKEYRVHTGVCCLSADDARRLLGFAVVRGTGYLSLLGVAPAARRTGVGSDLVAVARDRHDELACHVRAANGPARWFYRHLGFSARRRVPGYYDDGDDALLFRLADS